MKRLSKEDKEDIEQMLRVMKKALPDTIEVAITVLILSTLGIILGLPIDWYFFLVPRKVASCLVLIFTIDASMRLALEEVEEDLHTAAVHILQAVIMALVMILIVFFTGP